MVRKIRPDGRKHRIPLCMYDFFGYLESLSGVEAVNGGRHIYCGSARDFETNIQYYNESKRTFRVKVSYDKFVSYYDVRVSPEMKDYVENQIRNYKPD